METRIRTEPCIAIRRNLQVGVSKFALLHFNLPVMVRGRNCYGRLDGNEQRLVHDSTLMGKTA